MHALQLLAQGPCDLLTSLLQPLEVSYLATSAAFDGGKCGDYWITPGKTRKFFTVRIRICSSSNDREPVTGANCTNVMLS